MRELGDVASDWSNGGFDTELKTVKNRFRGLMDDDSEDEKRREDAE